MIVNLEGLLPAVPTLGEWLAGIMPIVELAMPLAVLCGLLVFGPWVVRALSAVLDDAGLAPGPSRGSLAEYERTRPVDYDEALGDSSDDDVIE